ncbi:MAG: M48 family metalloprotease [Candidatus Baldrarchaeia archaeon]
MSSNFFKHSINVQNAILRHERAHIINKDILKLFLLSLTFNILLMLLVLIFPQTKVMNVTLFLWILFLWIVVKSIELRADITSVRNEVEANELVDALIEIGVEVKKASGEILDIINRGEERKPEILGDMSIKRPKSRLKRIIKWIRIHPPLYIRINETKNFKKYKSKTLLYFIPKILHLMLADIL